MKHLGVAVILVFTLVACSPQQDQDAKNDPISIDKAQIDVAESDSVLNFARPGKSYRFFFLTNTAPADEVARWKHVQNMDGRTVRFMDGREVLGTGKIKGVLEGKVGLSIAFPSPEALEDLERKLGFELRYKLAEECLSNMTRIVTAARAWAHSHNEVLPSDLLSLKMELVAPQFLVCPADPNNEAVWWDWSKLKTNRLTYRILSPGAPANESTQTFLRCPIHGFAASADGSVRKPDVK
jgi:hypothetical protein